ncbi:MAG: hypothetical protein E7579_05100 [Ruminococcaceae bacterium]|nr:hypothetical protein [Oscillospiraceae bacterium]
MASFYNQATLTYNGTTTTSNITTGEILDVLSVTKTAVADGYAADCCVTYIVSLVNSGTVPFTGLTVTDNLGEFTDGTLTLVPLTYKEGSLRYFVNGVPQAAPSVTAESPLTITGITVPAGGNVTLVYAADVNRFAPLDTAGTITNEVSVSGGGLGTPITAEATVTAETKPLLAITKSLNPTSVAENGQITYTFVIENYGNRMADATDNVSITDLFDPRLENITVTFNGDVLTEPDSYNYNAETGLFTTVAGTITVPAATYTRDSVTGAVTVTPGVAILTVTGTI